MTSRAPVPHPPVQPRGVPVSPISESLNPTPCTSHYPKTLGLDRDRSGCPFRHLASVEAPLTGVAGTGPNPRRAEGKGKWPTSAKEVSIGTVGETKTPDGREEGQERSPLRVGRGRTRAVQRSPRLTVTGWSLTPVGDPTPSCRDDPGLYTGPGVGTVSPVQVTE